MPKFVTIQNLEQYNSKINPRIQDLEQVSDLGYLVNYIKQTQAITYTVELDGKTYTCKANVDPSENLPKLSDIEDYYGFSQIKEYVETLKNTEYLPLAGGNLTGNLTVQNKNVVRTVNNSNADTNGNVIISNVVTGTLLPFAGSSVPDGYLLCNGAEVLKDSYSDLYSVIANTYGTASSPDKFKLPDFRGRFMQGANGNLGVYLEAGLPNITGSISVPYVWSTGGVTVLEHPYGVFYNETGLHALIANLGSIALAERNNSVNAIWFDASKSNAIYSKSTTVQPPALAVNILIKY